MSAREELWLAPQSRPQLIYNPLSCIVGIGLVWAILWLAFWRATANDAEEIAALLLGAFQGFEALYAPEAFRTTTPPASELARRLSDGPTWVATVAQALCGTVAALDRGHEVYIRSMAVLPAARKQGVATQLLTVVHAYAVSRDARRPSLTTTPFSTLPFGSTSGSASDVRTVSSTCTAHLCW